MEKKFITAQQKEKVSNRLILNFGILLAGALILLYVYNFNSGYPLQVKSVLGVLGIVFAVITIAMFVLGHVKKSKVKRYSAIPFGAFLSCAIISYLPKIPFFISRYPAFSTNMAIGLILILMALYFVVLAIYTGIYFATHKVIVEKKKIQHKKKK